MRSENRLVSVVGHDGALGVIGGESMMLSMSHAVTTSHGAGYELTMQCHQEGKDARRLYQVKRPSAAVPAPARELRRLQEGTGEWLR